MRIRDRFAELWDSADVLDSFWRIWASPYVTILLLLGLAAVVCLGTLLPQRPVEALSDAAVDSLWQASLRARYGGAAEWLVRLRLSDLYRSLWLRGLLGLLAFNLVLGVVDLFRPRYRPCPDATEAGRSTGSPELLLERVTENLRGQRYRVLAVTPRGETDAGAASPKRWRDAVAATADETKAGIGQHLAYADRFASFPILVYMGLLLVLGGLLLSERTAWWEVQIPLRPGQVRPIGHGTSLALRADTIEADYDRTSGRLRGGRTELTFLRAAGPAGAGRSTSLYDHTPSLYGGILFYQMSTEPVLLIQAQDTTGHILALQTPETGATQSSEVTLRFREETASRFIVALNPTTPNQDSQLGPQFDQQGNEGYVLVPSRDLSLRLLYVPPAPGEVAPTFQAEAFRGGERSPFHQFKFASAETVEIDGDRYLFQPQRHAVIKFGQDYALLPILLGAVMVLFGLILSVWRPPRRLWLATQPIGGQVSLRLLTGPASAGRTPGAVGSAQGQAAPWFEGLVQTLGALSAQVSPQEAQAVSPRRAGSRGPNGDASPDVSTTGPSPNPAEAGPSTDIRWAKRGSRSDGTPWRYAVLLGLTLLTVSLLLGAVAQFYSQGVYWDWARAESWRLLAWLFFAASWCAYVMLGWRGRRLWVLAALGAVPALLALLT